MEATQGRKVQDVNAATLKGWLERGEAILVDVREPAEHAGERIPAAHLAPLSTFAPAQVPVEPGKKLVLHCALGQRSTQAGHQLLAAGFAEVYNLQGGIQAWKDAGYTVERSQQAPLSLQRQVQIVAGSLVLLGTILGAVVSPWFLVLSGFVGAGLIFAGLTNTCGMAMLLAKLPYNQRA
jgi:rhodanese-related sulfurtransferase